MDLLKNADGSVDLYFGPAAPAGKEKNWMQTVPGKGWNTILRLYGPLEPWFDKTWRPGMEYRRSLPAVRSQAEPRTEDASLGEIELVK